MGKIRDAVSKAADTARFLSEPPESPDFGKSRDEWKASKEAAKRPEKK